MFSFIRVLLAASLCHTALCAQLPVYLFTDFGGGRTPVDQAISDWQTTIELAGGARKTAGIDLLFFNDTATPLNPKEAGAELAAAFPYEHHIAPLHTVVVHVIDPGVGNGSDNPRAIVWRKDGILFIGPDNGTLSAACPPDSIAGVWEIDAARINAITGNDTEAGGTFHGRDLFSIAAYLLATNKAYLDDIGTRYPKADLRFRLPVSSKAKTIPRFAPLYTDRWHLIQPPHEPLIATAYYLAIIQWPLYREHTPQPKVLFSVEGSDDLIAIVNRKTGNIYIGPDNGLGSAFFKGFDQRDIWVTQVSPALHRHLDESSDNEGLFQLLLELPPYHKAPRELDLIAHVVTDTPEQRTLEGIVWIDAYGNIKTTLTNQQLSQQLEEGYRNIAVTLNGITHPVRLANSFAEVSPGEAFLYVGSSAAAGDNPHRSKRYVEVSSNGTDGRFGADLFTANGLPPHSGQLITFSFLKAPVKLPGTVTLQECYGRHHQD